MSRLTLWVPGVFLIICSRGPEIHLCFLQNFADKTTDGKIRFSISFLVSFELFFQELFFGHKECFIQPYLPRAFSRWKNARRASHVYIRGWPPRGVTQNTYIYVVGTQRVNDANYSKCDYSNGIMQLRTMTDDDLRPHGHRYKIIPTNHRLC